jgi:hypothetical protein
MRQKERKRTARQLSAKCEPVKALSEPHLIHSIIESNLGFSGIALGPFIPGS